MLRNPARCNAPGSTNRPADIGSAIGRRGEYGGARSSAALPARHRRWSVGAFVRPPALAWRPRRVSPRALASLKEDGSNHPTVWVIMGVSGCGKSTVGALLADALGCPFYEGDEFHPPANVAKMQAGTPLTDADRWPWLERLAAVMQRHLAQGRPAVLSCSALKPEYRHRLGCGSVGGAGGSGVAFVLLEPPRASLEARLARRAAAGHHFMPPSLLASQLGTLRYDPAELYLHFLGEAALQPPADIVRAILRRPTEEQSGQPGQDSGQWQPGQSQG